MSAIWGSISFSTPLSSDMPASMKAPYLNNCKIDSYSHIIESHVFMACGIQYITSEASLEKLPIYDSNHEIYFNTDSLLDNREELIQALDASPQEPDGTLMYLAYLKWGIKCLNRFRGLFALAIYDKSRQTLYLATDQTASRCLYYYHLNDTFIFSTLIKPILAVNPNITFNGYYLKDYLSAPGLMPNIVSTETPYSDIYKLNPGTYLEITRNSITEKSYWNPSLPLSDIHCRTPRDYGSYFRELYNTCVKDALRCNGEVGIAMSSGLDSATVGALAATHLVKADKKLMTYTYVPCCETTVHRASNHIMNEQKDVESILSMYANMIPHFLNNEGKNCLSELDNELAILEFPFKAYVNMPNLCEIYRHAAADNCKILLTGQCGNSTVSHGYIDDVLYDLYSKKHYFLFLSYLNHYSKTVRESRKKALIGCYRYFQHAQKVYSQKSLSYNITNSFVSPDIRNDYPLEKRLWESGNTILESIPTSDSYYKSGLYKSAMYTYLGELETKMGLANGIIIRDPTKDIRMLSFCYHLPYRLFAYMGIPRWLIRENLRDLLPNQLLDNWMRYGVQNADYISRIERDMEQILPSLNSVKENFLFSEWINNSELTRYLDQLAQYGMDTDFWKFDDLIYIFILHQFIRQTKF